MLMLSITLMAMSFRGMLYNDHKENGNAIYIKRVDFDKKNGAKVKLENIL